MKGLWGSMGALAGVVLFASLPASTHYQLQSYGTGAGGTAGSASTHYSLEGTAGQEDSGQLNGNTYSLNAGFIAAEQANVPPAPTFTNSSNWYDHLHLTLATGSNPTDAKFAIAISTDNFATTQYVQNDNTVGPALGTEDYQTYAQWGGSGGFDVVGLTANTTYTVKVKATQGNYTETGYGPTASAATVNPTLTFDIDVSASDTETNPPYTLSIGNLLPGSVVSAPQKIWLDFATNGNNGGDIFIYGSDTGLKSLNANYTIASISGDLGTQNEGFGAQSASATQSTGGPIAADSPYNSSGQTVGIADTTIRKLYSATAPVTGGRTSLQLLAKAQSITPSSADYTDLLTFVASASF